MNLNTAPAHPHATLVAVCPALFVRKANVSVCIEFSAIHVTHIKRQMDKQTEETTVAKDVLKTGLLIIRFTKGS